VPPSPGKLSLRHEREELRPRVEMSALDNQREQVSRADRASEFRPKTRSHAKATFASQREDRLERRNFRIVQVSALAR